MELRSWARTAAPRISSPPDSLSGRGDTATPTPLLNGLPVRAAGGSQPGGDPPVVITVAYHSAAALPRLAADLAGQSRPPALWLLVDNAPSSAPLDLTPLQAVAAAARPNARTLPLERLVGREGDGFGAGCNRALDALEAAGWCGWVWLLNPDTELPDGREIERIVTLLSGMPQQALLGTAVADPDGSLEASGGWIGRGLAFRSRQLSNTDAHGDRPVTVDWLSGCSLLLRPAALPRPRFDPCFPLYYEDMDLCLRLGLQGSPVLWLPEPRLLHRRGSGSAAPGPRRLRLSTLSYLRFLRRHCPSWVFALRSLRLLLLNLLRLPVRPRRSVAVLAAAATVLVEQPPLGDKPGRQPGA